VKTTEAKKWNEHAQSYADMADSPVDDVYEYEVNFPSILSLCPSSALDVLDLGSGNGVFTKLLAERYQHVIGSDVAPNMVQIAQRTFPEIPFQVLDLEERFPLSENSFDLIVIKLVLMFVENLENVAKECSRLLRKGGSVVISVHHPVHHFNSFLLDKYQLKEKIGYRVMTNGYFSEVPIEKTIGENKNLKFHFIHRTFSTYINTFTKHKLLPNLIDEPQPSPEFVEKHPYFKSKACVPSRLNIQFLKIT
jgi:SAM-dependent methyltransferase